MRKWINGSALLFAGLMLVSCSEQEEVASELILSSITPGQANAGDTVTLTGENFVPGMRVCFGSATTMCASVTLTSPQSGTAVVPAGGGSNLTVYVVLPNGVMATNVNVVFNYGTGGNGQGGNGQGSNGGGDVNGGGNGQGGNGGSEHIILGDAPRIEKMTPTGGVVGTSVTITGANLGGTYQVCFASECVNATANAEGDKIVVTAPEGTGNVQVRVDGKVDDKEWSLKAGSFSYIDSGNTDSQVPIVEWCRLNSVQSTLEIGKIATSYAEVFKEGCTPDAASRCDSMVGQIGYIDSNSPNVLDPLQWTWLDAKPNPQFSHENGNQNDEYMGELQSLEEGEYLVAFRFSMDNVHWTYCDYSSSSDGFAVDQAGQMTVAAQKPMTVEWCRIVNGNTSIASNVNEESEAIYAQFFVSDDCTKDLARCESLIAQVGYGKPRFSTPEELNENYTWTNAAFNDQYDGSGGMDHNEYMGVLSSAESDTYSVLFRGSVDGGKTWTYCDTSDNNSFSAGDALKWEVKGNEVNEKAIEWCVIQYPDSAEVRLGNSFDVYGRVYVSGCTDGGVECTDVRGEVGYGSDDNEEGFTWISAAYNPSPTLDVGNNNEFVGSLKPTEEGVFRYGYRFSLDGENWIYCDTVDDEQYLSERLGTVTVTEDKDTIGWCRLQHPGELKGVLNVETDAIYGQVLVENCTGKETQCASVKGQVGYGVGDDLELFTYVDAVYNIADGNNDEYVATLTVEEVGDYRLIYRFSVDGGTTWEYCDYDNEVGFNINNAGTMSITDKPVSQYEVKWCNLQYPFSFSAKAYTETELIYGRVFVENCTGKGEACPDVIAQVGYGTENDPSLYVYQNASFNTIDGNNDEYMGRLVAPMEGKYNVAYRFSVDGGDTWKYCDTYGNDIFNVNYAGSMDVQPSSGDANIDWCRTQYPESITINPGQEFTVYGQALVKDCTGQGQACSGLKAQVCIGGGEPAGLSSYFSTCFDAEYNTSASNTGDNDEFMAVVSSQVPGEYKVVYRFTMDSEPDENGKYDWEYCDYNDEEGFDFNQTSVLTVKDPEDWVWGEDISCGIASSEPAEGSTVGKKGEMTLYPQLYLNGCTNAGQCSLVKSSYCMYKLISYDADGKVMMETDHWTHGKDGVFNDNYGGKSNNEYIASFSWDFEDVSWGDDSWSNYIMYVCVFGVEVAGGETKDYYCGTSWKEIPSENYDEYPRVMVEVQ